MKAPEAPPRGALARWGTELALGVRLSLAGGRSGWARLAMISVGVGLGVAMLLIAATIPALVAARDARVTARATYTEQQMPRGPGTLLITAAKSQYRDHTIQGRLMQPEGDRAPLPPGVSRRLAPGEMVVSPALAELLASGEGALLRGRWGERVVGTIGAAGLSGPGEYAFYLGSGALTEDSAHRIRSFGNTAEEQGIPPVLLLLGVVGLVVLLVPVAVFLATAVRFGGEARDRQLAALRLVGADAAMTRRIAAGETLAGAVLGLAAGGLLFVAAGMLAYRLVPAGMSFYPADFRPVPALAALVVVLVPVGAVAVTVSALRRVVLEPLGVVRRSGDRRRQLWWRLLLPVAGLALLYPLRNGLSGQAAGFEYQVMAGVTALLAGVALLLPWLVEAAVRRLGGGGVAWQLAVRRLQLDSGTAVRAVSGIAVSVAGAIALQGLLVAVQAEFTTETGRPTDQFQVNVLPPLGADAQNGRLMAALRNAPGVRAAATVALMQATPAQLPTQESYLLQVGDCTVLRQLAKLGACTDGDTFVTADPKAAPLRPGGTYTLGDASTPQPGPAVRWTLPATARTVSSIQNGAPSAGTTILVTPAALRGTKADLTNTQIYVGLDPSDPDAIERLRNAAGRVAPAALVTLIQTRTVEATLVTIRQGLLAGATALLLLIGASMLVNVVEQLRERRRLLAVLVAFGTRRTTLTGSVLYQIAIPVLLGLTMAVATGTGLATILQAAADAPIRVDWLGIAATSSAAALVVLLTTTASLPLLWRLTRPGGLRSE
jgi:uncharacterized membrane protein YhaH (DUF805 family)